MELHTFMNFLLIAGATHGFIFNVATFLYRRRIEMPVVFLNLFVFFLSLNNLQSWLLAKGYGTTLFFAQHFIFPWYVMIVPMFYAFLIYYFGLEKRCATFLGLSKGVFIGEFLVQLVISYGVDVGVFNARILTTYVAFEDAITLGYSIFIFTKVVVLAFRYPKRNPAILKIDNLKWIKRTVVWGGLIFALWTVAVLLNIFSDVMKAPYSYYPLRIASSILIYWTGYQAFFRYMVYKDQVILRREQEKKTAGY